MTGSLVDLGWPLGFLLLGLAARGIYLLPQPQATVQAKDNKLNSRAKHTLANPDPICLGADSGYLIILYLATWGSLQHW